MAPRSIRHVQITVAEQLGVEGRGEFYDQTGALRDMVQNHLLQLLCILAMEPPASSDPDAVRDEKLKVLRALRPMTERDVLAKTVRGAVQGRRRRRQPVAGLPRRGGHAGGQRDRDVRRAQGGDRHLALGGRAVLPAHRQAACRSASDGNRRDVRGCAAFDLRGRRGQRTRPTSW